MKNLRYKISALLFCCCGIISAQDFTKDGIGYSIVSSTDKTVTVSSFTKPEETGDDGFTDMTGKDVVPDTKRRISKYEDNTYGVEIPEVVTNNSISYSVVSINDAVFKDITVISAVSIPSSVKTIGSESFSGCTALRSVTCYAIEAPTITANTFANISTDAALRVHYKSFSNYESADYWKEFTSMIPIETLVTAVTVNKLSAIINVNRTLQLSVRITPSTATTRDVTWKSLDPSIALVEDGLVTAKAVGVTVITATSTDGTNVVGQCEIQVVNPVTGISVSKAYGVGGVITLAANVVPSDATISSVTWSSSDESLANVTEQGEVSFTGMEGEVVIKATADDASGVVGEYKCLCIKDATVYGNVETKTYDYITYNRNFANTGWQALYIPMSLSFDEWKDRFDIARINDVHQYDYDDDGTIDETAIEIVSVKSGTTDPNVPYLIKAKETGQYMIASNDGLLSAAANSSHDVSSWNTIFTFTGTYQTISGDDMVANGYYALGNGSLHQAESSESSLNPFRWYMSVTDRNGNIKNINASKIRIIDHDDEATGISLSVEKANGNYGTFNLSGCRIANPNNGIYIKNGKKVFIK